MPDAGLQEIFDALGDQLETVLSPVIDNLQVVRMRMLGPSPPTLDIVAGPDPFQEESGFGDEDVVLNVMIRARVSPVDNEGGQRLLNSMRDWASATSVRKAVNANSTLSGKAQNVHCGYPSEDIEYVNPDGTISLLGCNWIVRIEV